MRIFPFKKKKVVTQEDPLMVYYSTLKRGGVKK